MIFNGLAGREVRKHNSCKNLIKSLLNYYVTVSVAKNYLNGQESISVL